MSKLNVLISPVGSKAPLIDLFREVLTPLNGMVVGVDMSGEAPAAVRCDEFFIVPPFDSPNFFNYINGLIKKFDIGLIVPVASNELAHWSAYAQQEGGTVPIAISAPHVIDICSDKKKTFDWLTENDIPTIKTYEIGQYDEIVENLKFPVYAKHRSGRVYLNNKLIYKPEEIKSLPDDWVVQESLIGEPEYTINMYIDREGHITATIPHRRIEIENGEVSRGITFKNDLLIDTAKEVVNKMGGFYGPINMQMFYNAEKKLLKVFDINPRFGGGYPLVHAAGGRFIDWLIKENILGEKLDPLEGFSEGVRLTRYKGEIKIHT